MAGAKTSAASKAATKPTQSKKASKKSAPAAESDAKVKKTTKKADGVKKNPTPYNIFFKANYARVKEEHPELLTKEMMAKMGEVWKTDPSNPKSPNYAGPPLPKTATK